MPEGPTNWRHSDRGIALKKPCGSKHVERLTTGPAADLTAAWPGMGFDSADDLIIHRRGRFLAPNHGERLLRTLLWTGVGGWFYAENPREICGGRRAGNHAMVPIQLRRVVR